MNLMLPDSGLLFWMTIIFVIVFLILSKFGFPVITEMVAKRTRRIEDALSAARKAEDAIAHLSQEQEKIVAETKALQAKIIQEAAAEIDRMILDGIENNKLNAILARAPDFFGGTAKANSIVINLVYDNLIKGKRLNGFAIQRSFIL